MSKPQPGNPPDLRPVRLFNRPDSGWDRGIGRSGGMAAPAAGVDRDKARDMVALIDFAQMNAFFESFYNVVGLPVAIVDLEGRVLASSRWQRLCVDFHRAHPDACQRCMESDLALAAQLDAGKPYARYTCGNGLQDCALPLVIDGLHIANLFTGQFLLAPPDLAGFEAQQTAYGFDAAGYADALSEIPVIDEARLAAVVELLSNIAQLIASQSLAERKARDAQANSEREIAERTRELQHCALGAEQSLAKYRDFFELSPVGIAINDFATGHFLEFNQALLDSIGYAAEEFQQLSYWDLTPREYEAAEAAQLKSLKDTGRYGPYEKEYLHRAGHRVPVLLHGRLIDGNRIYSIVQDISARKRSESALQASETRFRQLFESNRSVKLIVDPATGRIEDANPAACSFYGYTRARLLDLKICDINVAEWNEVQDEMARATAESRLYFNFRHRLASGEIRDVEVYSGPIDTHNGIRLYSIIHDITDKKRAHDELEAHRHRLEELVAARTEELTAATAAAEEASRAKSTFLANMSHEIRTPMNAILGMTHLLRHGEVTPKQAGQLKKIDTAAGHLLSIINDILDLSKIEAGKFELEEMRISIDAVLDKVAAMVSERASDKKLRLLIDAGHPPGVYQADQTRLCQALLNYVGNAIKFTDRGSVTIRSRVVEDSGRDALICFEVIDTGIGIPPDRLPLLFNAFTQADSSTTRTFGGTGLGLAITRRLAEVMGGTAGAHSSLGIGSTFWFTARLKRDSASSRAEAGHDGSEPADVVLARNHPGTPILLVEDEPLNQEIMLELLGELGLQLDVADDGLHAVEKVQQRDYALIIMDMQMPRLDGLDATRRIRLLPRGAAVPIVAMTANAFAEDRIRCIEAGMNDHLPKPIEPDLLFSTLLKWLQNPG